MAGYFKQENNGKWSVQFYYVDYSGVRRRKHKIGFKTKTEARIWQEEFIRKAQADMDMTFESFVAEYFENVSPDLKGSTIDTKKHIIELHILPYFRSKKIADISALDVRKWQNEVKKNGFSDTYLRTINAQLSAIFNHAVRFYHLSYNPSREAGTMGKNKSGNMGIWSQEDMELFLDAVKDKDEAYYAFKLIYWTGIRLGELLALCVEDIDGNVMNIKKTTYRKHGKDVVTSPKSDASCRRIILPSFLALEMEEYKSRLYGILPQDRLFRISKGYLEKEIKRGAKAAGIKEIRVHDLRHSHASLLIANNVDIATIANRLGHDNIKTTLSIYAHLFDKNARAVANTLDDIYIGNQEEI